MPGGYLNWDENLEQAAIREVFEEYGITITNPKLFKVYSDPKRDLDGRQNLAHIYIAHTTQDVQKIDTNEILEAKWFPLDQLPEKIGFDHRQIIEDYKKSL